MYRLTVSYNNKNPEPTSCRGETSGLSKKFDDRNIAHKVPATNAEKSDNTNFHSC